MQNGMRPGMGPGTFPLFIAFVADFAPAAPMIVRCFGNDAFARLLLARGSDSRPTKGGMDCGRQPVV